MLYWLFKILLSPILFALFRIRTTNVRNVPFRGPAILAANHQSFCDSFFLPLVMVRRVTYVAKAEYFDSFKTAWFFRAAGQIPIRRGGGPASERALESAREVLRKGQLFAIYPEGTRSPDDRIHKGHTGVARLAIQEGVPVVPVAIIGTSSVQPIGARLMKPFKKVEIRFGEPIELAERFGSRKDDPLSYRQATDEIMFAIVQLSGKQYVDRYASRDKAVLAGPAPQIDFTDKASLAGPAPQIDFTDKASLAGSAPQIDFSDKAS